MRILTTSSILVNTTPADWKPVAGKLYSLTKQFPHLPHWAGSDAAGNGRASLAPAGNSAPLHRHSRRGSTTFGSAKYYEGYPHPLTASSTRVQLKAPTRTLPCPQAYETSNNIGTPNGYFGAHRTYGPLRRCQQSSF